MGSLERLSWEKWPFYFPSGALSGVHFALFPEIVFESPQFD
jgi:hypothetical protein